MATGVVSKTGVKEESGAARSVCDRGTALVNGICSFHLVLITSEIQAELISQTLTTGKSAGQTEGNEGISSSSGCFVACKTSWPQKELIRGQNWKGNSCGTCPAFPHHFLWDLSTNFFCKVGHLLLQRQQDCFGKTEGLKPYRIACFSALFPFLHAVIYPYTLLQGGVKNWCHAKIEVGIPPCLPASYGHRSGVKNWCQRRIRRGGKHLWQGYSFG